MKRGAPTHPKVHALASIMKIPHALAVGYLELLWHFTARYAPQGDIGRFDDAVIAKACSYQGDALRLVSAMCAVGLLEVSPRCRLTVHDWHEHADDSVRKSLHRKGLQFLTLPTVLSGQTPDKVQTDNGQSPDTVQTKIACLSLSHSHSHSLDSVPDMTDAFEAIWRDYPAKGRTKKVACQHYFVDVVGNLRGESLAAMLERIHEPLRPGGAWAESDKWANGFIQGFDTYLSQRQWDEEPVPAEDGERLTPAQRRARAIEDSWK